MNNTLFKLFHVIIQVSSPLDIISKIFVQMRHFSLILLRKVLGHYRVLELWRALLDAYFICFQNELKPLGQIQDKIFSTSLWNQRNLHMRSFLNTS